MRLALVLFSLALACGSREPAASEANDGLPAGEPIEPPFAVRGDLAGLTLTYFDEDGPQVAASLADVPEARRGNVRVDSLELPPDQRDPDHVYVADLRAMEEGRYPVRRYPRASFDTLVDRLAGREPAAPGAEPALADAPIVLYGASWCGACRSAAGWFRSRGIEFEEKDIEREPGARTEMLAKARAQGVPTGSIPIIDVRGRLTTGFDPSTLMRLLNETQPRTL